MRDLMGFHANGGSGEQPAHPSWQQGGAEHVLMDASYYLDDLLRNMQANATEADAPPAARGAAPLQVHSSLGRQSLRTGRPVCCTPVAFYCAFVLKTVLMLRFWEGETAEPRAELGKGVEDGPFSSANEALA